ncbi:MAG: hypothetical protein HOP02_05465 [Methylococcaceae bacterium]|nr:hypothetical protein [Methylococcaceae bacterium]
MNQPTHNTQSNPVQLYSGPIIAATLSPLLGFYTLMISHHVSRVTKDLDKLVHAFGYWIPGSTGTGPDGSIGSYSGKETLALGVWFLTWLIFHFLWQKQDLPVKRWIPVFLGAIGFVTLCLFHPFIDPILLLLLSSGR